MKKDLSIISNSIIQSEKKRKNKDKEINSRVRFCILIIYIENKILNLFY